MLYRKLKRVWSRNDMNYIPGFREAFPELSRLSSEELCDRFCDLKIDWFMEEKRPVRKWVRITLPFAVLLMIIMLLWLPFNFFITGRWGYRLGKNNRVINWFRELALN